jgi:ketosteroid isomerase-like protein
MRRVETQETIEAAAARGADETAIRAAVYGYYQAVNEARWDDVAACFHEDGVLLVPSRRPKVGHAAIRRFYGAHGETFAEHHDDVPLLMIDGNRVLTLIDFHGVDRRGNHVHYWNFGVFTMEGGRFRQYRVIFDTAELPQWIREYRSTAPRAATSTSERSV